MPINNIRSNSTDKDYTRALEEKLEEFERRLALLEKRNS